jgi:hypothetical protein
MKENFKLAKVSDIKYDIVLLEKGLHILVGLSKIGFAHLEGRKEGLDLCFRTIRQSGKEVGQHLI